MDTIDDDGYTFASKEEKERAIVAAHELKLKQQNCLHKNTIPAPFTKLFDKSELCTDCGFLLKRYGVKRYGE